MSIPPEENPNALPQANNGVDDPRVDSKPELPQKVIELLKVVPEPQRAEIISTLEEQVTEEMMMYRFSGPIPPPEILKGMDEVVPGAAKDIIQMTLDQSTHRRQMEKYVIEQQNRQSHTGQWLGFSIAIIALGLAGWLINGGHDAAGGVLGTLDIVALVSVFVLGKHYQKRDLTERKDS